MTIEQIVEQDARDHADYEAHTVVTKEGETIADLRKILDAVVSQDDWKAPWAAFVPAPFVGSVLRAVEFFHADKAETVGIQSLTGKVLMRGNGYQG